MGEVDWQLSVAGVYVKHEHMLFVFVSHLKHHCFRMSAVKSLDTLPCRHQRVDWEQLRFTL